MAYPVLRRTFFPLVTRAVRTVEGEEHIPRHGPFIVAANHVSYVEPAVLSALVILRTQQKVYALTKESIWKIFHALRLADWFGMVRVDPHHRDQCLSACLAELQSGNPVLIFPEGTRNPGPALQRGKTGVARLALLSGAPVIPVGYEGPPGMTTLEAVRNTLFRPPSIRIRIGAPLHFQSVPTITSHAQLEQVTTTIMETLAQLCGKPYRP